MSLNRKVFTLVFIRKGTKVLLGLKKRGFGFGFGKWNGFGGKVEKDESFAEGAAREVEEECGLNVDPNNLEHTAEIEFEFKGDPVKFEMHVFQTKIFSGNIRESDEMKPEWFDEESVPFDKMWVDAKHWYHHMFSNRRFRAYFLLEGYETVLEEKIVLQDN